MTVREGWESDGGFWLFLSQFIAFLQEENKESSLKRSRCNVSSRLFVFPGLIRWSGFVFVKRRVRSDNFSKLIISVRFRANLCAVDGVHGRSKTGVKLSANELESWHWSHTFVASYSIFSPSSDLPCCSNFPNVTSLEGDDIRGRESADSGFGSQTVDHLEGSWFYSTSYRVQQHSLL